MPRNDAANTIAQALAERFGEKLAVDPALPGLSELARLAAYRSHRRFLPRAIEPELIRILCACALSAPSKSDLQQSDIVIVSDMSIRKGIVATIPDMPWINDAPAFLVFVANAERLPLACKLHGKPFPNDHLDAFFNAVVDAAIVMTTFINAATQIGLGCCPISAVRDQAGTVGNLLRLPQRAVPVAGLCVGWPAEPGSMTPRLSLETTVIRDRYGERDLPSEIAAYDRRREALRPYRRQRRPDRWGTAAFYGWSEDKARQYAEPTRTDFGAFVREKGFRLD
ncbi:MAG TPA: nitroreductase family protein [Xanthobacteraceae bacterium]|jgi:nitroreductase/FMN reductase [NAD(P)H]